MKARYRIMAATGLVLPVFSFGTIAYAVDATTTQTTTSTTTTSTGTSTTTTPSSSDVTAQKELNARLQNRVAEMKTKLTAAQQDRLKTRCKPAQGMLQSVSKRIDGIQKSRTEVYGGLVARLSALMDKLKAQNIDTTTLNSEITALKAKIDTYNTDLTTYKQAVADLSSMDCATNPTAFQASLDAARAALTTVKTDSTAIHDYVMSTIKPTLEKIKSQLTNSTSSSTSTTTGGNN